MGLRATKKRRQQGTACRRAGPLTPASLCGGLNPITFTQKRRITAFNEVRAPFLGSSGCGVKPHTFVYARSLYESYRGLLRRLVRRRQETFQLYETRHAIVSSY
jgi:hypothetical protein